jgi:hypothetical protein
LLESLLANQFEVNIEIEDNEDGTEKVLTITTTSILSTPTPLAEEEPIEEQPEEDNDSSGGGSDNGNDDPPSEEPPQEPDPPEPEPPEEGQPIVPPFG